MKVVLLVLVLSAHFVQAFSQNVGIAGRLRALSYLAQGESKYKLSNPTQDKKGNCTFDFHCNNSYSNFLTDSALLRARYYISAVLAYALADSASHFDSITVKYSPYDTDYYSYSEVIPIPENFQIPSLTEKERWAVICPILPFQTYAVWDRDSIELILKIRPGYSPPIRSFDLYAKTVAFVISDFVLQKKLKPITISYKDESHFVKKVKFDSDKIDTDFLRKSDGRDDSENSIPISDLFRSRTY